MADARMFSVGEKFEEETEHQSDRYIITAVESNRIYAKRILNDTEDRYGEEEFEFSTEELINGSTFASYWFFKASL